MKLARNRKGFTLTELMVVVVILGILVAIAIPIYTNLDGKAKDSANEANIRTIKSVVLQFCMEESIDQEKLTIVPTLTEGKLTDLVITYNGTSPATTYGYSDLKKFIDEWPMSPYRDGESYQFNGSAEETVTPYPASSGG